MIATASYRLHPRIHIKSPIPPASIPKFISCFSPGVISTRKNNEGALVSRIRFIFSRFSGKDEAFVACARKDGMSREVLRHADFRDKVELSRIRDWFICACCHFPIALFNMLGHATLVNIESEGPYAPERLLVEAIAVMRDKISVVRNAVAVLDGGSGDVDMG